jgi:hypothetical protein
MGTSGALACGDGLDNEAAARKLGVHAALVPKARWESRRRIVMKICYAGMLYAVISLQATAQATKNIEPTLVETTDWIATRLTDSVRQWGVVAEVVPNSKALSRAQELAEQYFEGARGNTPQHAHTLHAAVEGAHVREAGYGLSLEGASAAGLLKSTQAKS